MKFIAIIIMLGALYLLYRLAFSKQTETDDEEITDYGAFNLSDFLS
jgi:hypothetical protein